MAVDDVSSKTRGKSHRGRAVVVYRVLIAAGVALICVAVALFANEQPEDMRAKEASEAVLMRLEEVCPQTYEAHPPYLLPTSDGAMPVEWIDQRDYIGSIAIPSLGKNLPVGATTDDDRLRDCPCRYEGSYLNDDLVVCGEGYESHFGSLGSMGIGDEVDFVAVDGALHRYEVSNVETDELEDIDAVVDDWDLTLFTFTGDDKCCVVRCVRAESL